MGSTLKCPNCGANILEGITDCPACGRPVVADHRDTDQDTVIDVSGDQPELVGEEAERSGGFVSSRVGNARVYVARGGQRACLIPLIVIVLLSCCACLGFWFTIDSVF